MPSDGGAPVKPRSGSSVAPPVAVRGVTTTPTSSALVRLRYEHQRLERIARALKRLAEDRAAHDPDGDDGKES